MSNKGKVFLVISIIFLISFAGIYFVLQTWMPFLWIFIGLMILSFSIYLYFDFKLLKELFTSKESSQGMGLLSQILSVIALLTALNIVAVKKNLIFDFSQQQLTVLSPLTISILKNLDDELSVKFFYKSGAEKLDLTRRSFNQVLDNYRSASHLIKVQFIEVNSEPQLTEKFKVTQGYGEAFLEYKGRINRIESQSTQELGQKFTEQDFTNAIIKVTRKNLNKVFFLEGHGEKSFQNLSSSQSKATSLSQAYQLLEKNSYQIERLNIFQTGKIPSEARLIMIVGPQESFQPKELEIIENYLSNGGALFLAFDNKFTAGLEKILKKIGLRVNNHYVFNILSGASGQTVNSNEVTVAADFSAQHKITQSFTPQSNALFLKPMSIGLEKPVNDTITSEVLIKSPEASVALTELNSQKPEGSPQSYDLMTITQGSLDLTPVKTNTFKVVTLTDSDFMADGFISQNINRDILLNTVAELSGETDLVSLSPKEVQITKLLLSPPEFNYYYKIIVLFVFIPIPLIFLMISLVLWYKKRHA